MSTVSALPERLQRHGRLSGEMSDEIARIGGEVSVALERLRASSGDVPVTIAPLDTELRVVSRVTADLDEWVGRVGDAFELAGQGTAFLSWLFDSLHGRAFSPVGVQPDWTHEEVAVALEAILGLPDDRAPGEIAQPLVSPDLVRTFMATLSTAQRDDLLLHHPELVGPVDGMPHAMRYAANRTLIDRALDDARLRGDDDLVTTLEGLDGADRQFLFFDPAGDGRAVEVFGELDTADNVSVFVPGITNRLDNFHQTSDNARRVYADMKRLAPGDDNVAIAWLGYDTPELHDAIFPGKAHSSAPLLRQLWDGVALPAKTQTTLIGHSYGSLVSATALRGGFEGIDSFVVVGSPGLEASSLSDLDLAPGTDFYSARAPFDTLVGSTESFGRDPSDPRFDATRLATGRDGDGKFVTGHSSYTARNSESLRNLALIATGQLDAITTIEPSAADRVVGAIDDTHNVIVEGPIDALQAIDDVADEFVHSRVDDFQERVPLGPLQVVIDNLQKVDKTIDSVIDTGVDGLQRVTSPDFWGDVIGDWIAVDGPGRLANRVRQGGEYVVDGVRQGGEYVVDGVRRGGEIVEDGWGSLYDNTLGRFR